MRMLKFARVDYMKCRRFGFILILFPALSAIMMIVEPDSPVLFSITYCLFAGIILSSFPFNMESREERGFVQMLPARPGELVWGHYAFGLLVLLATFLLGIASLMIARIFVPSIRLFSMDGEDLRPLYPAVLGIAVVFVGLQNLLFTVLRFENAHLAQIFRIVPAFVFFFGMSNGYKESMSFPDLLNGLPGVGILAVCFAVFLLLGCVSSFISIRKWE